MWLGYKLNSLTALNLWWARCPTFLSQILDGFVVLKIHVSHRPLSYQNPVGDDLRAFSLSSLLLCFRFILLFFLSLWRWDYLRFGHFKLKKEQDEEEDTLSSQMHCSFTLPNQKQKKVFSTLDLVARHFFLLQPIISYAPNPPLIINPPLHNLQPWCHLCQSPGNG